MFFMSDHCWKGRKSFMNICYLHYFFQKNYFYVILPLDEAMAEVISFAFRDTRVIVDASSNPPVSRLKLL